MSQHWMITFPAWVLGVGEQEVATGGGGCPDNMKNQTSQWHLYLNKKSMQQKK